MEAIALDPDSEDGIATIGSMDANNLSTIFSQTQATQGGSQVRFVSILAAAACILQTCSELHDPAPALLYAPAVLRGSP